MDLPTVLLIIAAIVSVGVLYRVFYRARDTGGTDDRNWVNDTNYNINSAESELDAIQGATRQQSATLVESDKADGPFPPSEDEFHDLRQNLGSEPIDSHDLERKVSKPS